jgi:hypothetical protein
MRYRKIDNRPQRYAGLASQWAVGLSITLFGGKRLDDYFDFKKPLLTWILPLIFIIGMLIKLIVETNKPSKK